MTMLALRLSLQVHQSIRVAKQDNEIKHVNNLGFFSWLGCRFQRGST